MIKKIAASVALIWIASIPVLSQHSELNMFYNGIYGFNISEYDLLGDDIQSSGVGYQTGMNYTFLPKNTRVRYGIAVGYKQFRTQGNVGVTNYSSNTSKATLSLQATYLLSDRLELGLLGSTENNLDFERFFRYSTDLFRYNVGILTTYQVLKGLKVTFSTSSCIYPKRNIYVVSNPAQQISLGLSFNVLSL